MGEETKWAFRVSLIDGCGSGVRGCGMTEQEAGKKARHYWKANGHQGQPVGRVLDRRREHEGGGWSWECVKSEVLSVRASKGGRANSVIRWRVVEEAAYVGAVREELKMRRGFFPMSHSRCDGCGAVIYDDRHHTDEEACGLTDGPGFFLCAPNASEGPLVEWMPMARRAVHALLGTLPLHFRREHYRAQRARNERRGAE